MTWTINKNHHHTDDTPHPSQKCDENYALLQPTIEFLSRKFSRFVLILNLNIMAYRRRTPMMPSYVLELL